MRIDPVTHEVTGATPLQPLYVWEAPVRVWHWATVLCMMALIPTGWLIGAPPPANLADTWSTNAFGSFRGIHFVAGMLFTVLFCARLGWCAVGNRYSRMIFAPPVWSGRWWRGVLEQIRHYLFLRPHAPEYAGHNPLAQLAMFLMFSLPGLGIIVTGLALYAQAWGWGTGLMQWFGWVFVLAGDAQAVRTAHHVFMYVLVAFTVFHVYMSFREDVMGGATTVSSMTTGLRMFKEAGHD